MFNKLQTLKQTIDTKEELWHYLNIAMEVELSTIPPYLCALYSIPPGHNQDAYNIIQSVVVEEMLHLTLVGNILNATSGPSLLNDPEFIPDYPTQLPDSSIEVGTAPFEVPLQRFSPAAIETFMRIEQPGPPNEPPKVEGWHTIGQFYAGLMQGLKDLCEKLTPEVVFDGHHEYQIKAEQYYGAGGELIVVTDGDAEQRLQHALDAMQEIVDQGEGLEQGVFDGDELPLRAGIEEPVPAHFFRFEQIMLGRYYQAGDKPHEPTGETFEVDWNAAYPMAENPKAGNYPDGSGVNLALQAFNQTYMNMLDELQLAFTGHPERLREGIGRMYKLKYQAEALMKTQSGDERLTVGPSFQSTAE